MERLPKWLQRRYRVGYALACGNTWDCPMKPFFSLRMAEKYVDWFKAKLSRAYPTNCVYITDEDNPEWGNRYGSSEDE